MMFIRHSQTGAVVARQRTGSWGGLNAALHDQDGAGQSMSHRVSGSALTVRLGEYGEGQGRAR